MIKLSANKSWFAPLACAGVALVIRLMALAAYQHSILFQPIEGSAHDRSVYVQAIQQAAAGHFLPQGALEYLPLYPWLAGMLAAVFGNALIVAAVLGIVCELLTTVLIVLFARRLGAVNFLACAAGLLYAVYPLAIIYSLTTMPNTLNALGVTAFAYAAHLILQKPASPRGMFLLGFLAGIITLGFAGMLTMAMVVLLIFAVRHKSIAAVLCFIAGMALPITPPAIHNSRAEGQFVLLTTHGGFNLYMGNHEKATGYPLRVLNFRMTAKSMLEDAHHYAEQMTGAPMTRAQSSGWWKDQARLFWREHPMEAANLFARKLMLFWNYREVDDLRMLEQLRITEPFFRKLYGTPFALIGLMGLTGLVFARGAAVPKWTLLAGMFGLVLFFITARYRLTFVPLMLVLGVSGIENLRTAWKTGRRSHLLPLIPMVCFVMFPFSMRDQRPVDHYNVATQLTNMNRDAEAMEVVQRGIDIDPNFADLYFARGNILFRQAHFTQAETAYTQALSRNPNNPTAVFNLALSITRAGDYCRARDALLQMQAQNMPMNEKANRLLGDLSAACDKVVK